MKHKHAQFGKGFRILIGNKRSQAAQMTLPPGQSEGGPDNQHVGADQWLLVVAGKGEATVNRRKYSLKEGSVLLIEHGDLHELRNTGKTPLKTLSIYVPPAYNADGDELPAGKSA